MIKTFYRERRMAMELICFIVGVLVGMTVIYITKPYDHPSGTFVIDLSDPLKDVCRIEFDESIDDIYMKKSIVLNVRTYDSHE